MSERTEAASTVGASKTYSGGVRALAGLDFAARFGEVTAVIGANGSGKSTLLRLLGGALRADSGSVHTLGIDPGGQPAALRAAIGYVPQHQALDPEMTGRETLALFCTLYGVIGAKQRERVEALTAAFGLREAISRRVSTYSGGLRQRLHLAVGLVHGPRLLLLDEPTSGLDPEGRAFIWQTMRSYAANGHALVAITHDLDDVARHCERVTLLSRGKTRIDGTPAEIIAQHGRVTMEITLERPPADANSVQERLKALAGVEHVECGGQTVTVRLRERPDTETAVLAALEQVGCQTAAFRREQPNLSSAYFQLTGQDLGADGGEAPGRRSGRGRQRSAP